MRRKKYYAAIMEDGKIVDLCAFASKRIRNHFTETLENHVAVDSDQAIRIASKALKPKGMTACEYLKSLDTRRHPVPKKRRTNASKIDSER